MAGWICLPLKSGVESVPRLKIGKYRTSGDDCIIPAEFTILFENVDKSRFEGVFSKYRVLYVDYDQNMLKVRVPDEEKFIPAAATEIEKLVDYACNLEGGGMKICEPGDIGALDMVAELCRSSEDLTGIIEDDQETFYEDDSVYSPVYPDESGEEILDVEEDLEPDFGDLSAVIPEEDYLEYDLPDEEAETDIEDGAFAPDYAEISPEDSSIPFDHPSPGEISVIEDSFMPEEEDEGPEFEESFTLDEFEELVLDELSEDDFDEGLAVLPGEEIPVVSETDTISDSPEIFPDGEFPEPEDYPGEEIPVVSETDTIFDSPEIFPDGEFPELEDYTDESGSFGTEAESIDDDLTGFEVTEEFEGPGDIVEESPVETLLAEAGEMVLEGRYEDALQSFDSVLIQEPGNTEALLGSVSLLLESGREGEACKIFRDNEMASFAGADLCFKVGMAFENSGLAGDAVECYKRALEFDPEDLGVIERYSALLINAGKFGEAAGILDSLALEESGSADLWVRKGDACLAAGMSIEAMESYRKSLELDPDNMNAALRLLGLLKNAERYGEASELLDSCLETHPEDPNLWFERGWISEKEEMAVEALAGYDRAISIDGGCTRAIACKALLLMREKKPEEALECYDLLIERKPDNAAVHHSRGLVLKVLGRKEEALDSFESAIRLDPSDMDAHVEAAGLLLDLGRFSDALDHYGRLLESGVSGTEILTGTGDAYRGLGMNEEALDSYRNAVESGGDISMALKGKAAILSESGQTAAAEEAYNAVLELIPGDTEVLNELASLYEDAGRPGDAVFAYERIVKVNPGDTQAVHGLVKNLISLGNYSRAIPYYDSLLAVHPDNSGLVAGKAFAYGKSGRKEEAVILYISALRMDPENPEYLIELVTLLSDLGRYAESLPYYERLTCLLPEETGFVMSKALALFTLRRYDEAVDCFEEVLKTHPNDNDALLNMGIALLRLGDRRGAMDCYRRSIDIDPAFGEEWSKRGVNASSFIEWELERIREVPKTPSAGVSRPAKSKTSGAEKISGDEKSLRGSEAAAEEIRSVAAEKEVPLVKKPTQQELNDPDYLYKKGLALARKGYYRAALKCFSRIEKISENNYEATFSKGIIYAKNGYYGEAIECFDRVLVFDPSHEKAKKARKMAVLKVKK